MEHNNEEKPEGEPAVKIPKPAAGNIADDMPLRDGDQHAADGYARFLGCKSESEDNGGANGEMQADGHADAAGDAIETSADADGLHSEGNGGANGDADGHADAKDEWKALTANEIANMDLHECRKHLTASKCPYDYIMCKDEDPTCLVRSILQLATS